MKGLFLRLPPFSPDYSGVGSVLFELGGVIAIHDGTGCTGNYLGHDEPRNFGSVSAVYTSNLRELDVVMGNDEDLLSKLEHAAGDLSPNFIAVLNSPAPMVIGTDFNALAKILEKRTGLPVLVFDTHGIAFYDQGQSEAMLALARRFFRQPPKPAYDINILGATPLDFGGQKQYDALITLLHEAGCRKVSSWGMGGDFSVLTAGAMCNYVVSTSALAAARYMEKEFGIPYIAGLPVGKSGVENLKRQLAGERIKSAEGRDAAKWERVWIIHDQVTANAWRQCLLQEGYAKQVDVGSFFMLDDSLRVPGDCHIAEEDDLEELARNGQYNVILGDSLLKEVVKPYCDIFIPLPHLAVSSCVHWDDTFVSIGAAANHILDAY